MRHLAAGRELLQTRTLWMVDAWSFTAAGQEWLNHEWLSDIIFYGWVALAVLSGVFSSVVARADVAAVGDVLVFHDGATAGRADFLASISARIGALAARALASAGPTAAIAGAA